MTRVFAAGLSLVLAQLVMPALVHAAEEVFSMPIEAAPNEARPVKQSVPVYPRAAAKKRVEGCVVVAVEVDAKGVGTRFAILDSQPAGVFDAATLAALHDWRWEQGKAGWLPQRIDYRMSSGSGAPLPCIEAAAARAQMFRIRKP